MHAVFGEFLGTLILILLGNGVVAGTLLKGTKGENGGWLAIVVGWGIAVTVAVYAVGPISGAHINPAITMALAWKGDFPWSNVAPYLLAQFGGAFVGASLVWLHYLPHWKLTDDPGAKRSCYCTTPAVRYTFTNILSEILATAMLVLVILFFGQQEFTQGLNPVAIGLLVVGIGLGLGGTTGFAINPARDLGPRIAHFVLPIYGKGSSDWEYAWIPVVGPLVGGILAVYIFGLFK